MNDLTLQSNLCAPGTLFIRAALVHALSHLTKRSLDLVARERYADDRQLQSVLRAAVGVADSTSPGWASELVKQDTQAFISDLPQSVYAALAARSQQVEFDAAGSVKVPYDAGDGSELAGAWVGENGVIPVKRGALAAAILKQFKMGVITPLSEEVARSSPVNAERFIRRIMNKDTAQALDAHFLSDSPGVPGVSPPGIVNGVPAMPPNSGGSAIENAIADLRELMTVIVVSGNGERIVIAMNTAQRLSLSLMRDGNQWVFRDELARGQLMGVEVVSSRNVPPGNVYLIDCADLITGLGVPELDASRAATLVAADAGPAIPTHATSAADRTAIGTAGEVPPDGGLSIFDPAQHAAGKVGEGAQAISMFQQWAVALRTVWPVSWATTRSGSVEWVSGVQW